MPVIVTVAGPRTAMSLAVRVSRVDVAEDVGLNEAVTPVGSTPTVNATLSEKPPVSSTEIAEVPVDP